MLIQLTELEYEEISHLANDYKAAKAYCESVIKPPEQPELPKKKSIEERLQSGKKKSDAHEAETKGVMSELEFTNKMTTLLPGADLEAVQKLISYAKELDAGGNTTKGEFFKETFVEYVLVTRHFSQELAQNLLNLCKTFTFNSFEIYGAAEFLQDGISPEKIEQMAIDGKCDSYGEKWEEFIRAKQEFEDGVLDIPIGIEKTSEAHKPPEQMTEQKPSLNRKASIEERLQSGKKKSDAHKTKPPANTGKIKREEVL